MAIAEFLVSTTRSVGRFKMADGPVERIGTCVAEPELLEIDVLEELTPWIEFRPNPGGGFIGTPTRETDDFAIHAELPVRPSKVTFLGCRTRARGTIGFPGRGERHHVIRADWCVSGAHVTEASKYQGARVRLSHLEEWARLSGLREEITSEPFSYSLRLEPVERVAVPGPERAELSLESSASFGNTNVHGSSISMRNRLVLEGASDWSLEDVLSKFVLPA